MVLCHVAAPQVPYEEGVVLPLGMVVRQPNVWRGRRLAGGAPQDGGGGKEGLPPLRVHARLAQGLVVQQGSAIKAVGRGVYGIK